MAEEVKEKSQMPFIVKDILDFLTEQELSNLAEKISKRGFRFPRYVIENGDLFTDSKEFSVLVESW